MFTHTINQETFLKSTACAVAVYAFFLIALALAGFDRLQASFLEMIAGVAFISLLVIVSYFTGVIPPLPLSLPMVGVYESIVHSGDSYILQGEGQPQSWWDVFGTRPLIVEYVPGSPLYVFSSVFAPVSFSSGIVHVWDWYEESTHSWQQRAEIAFVITGGRDGGYRGYSTLSNLVPGQYRVSVETLSGQVIGRTYFEVVDVQTQPPLVTTVNE